MNMKVLVLAAVALVCGVGFVACDNDGGSGADPQPAESSSGVSAVSSSGISTGSSSATKAVSSSGVSAGGSSSSAVCEEGATGYLTLSGVKVYYVCKGNAWVAVPVSSSSSAVVSSSSAASSSSRYNMDSLFNSKLSYGEFTDPRDGQMYKTIVIGYYQYEYFAENLNYGKQVPMNGGQADSAKYCYNDDPWYCAHHFGGLYRWSTAMGFPAACDSVKTGSSSACPDTIKLPIINPHQELAPQYPQVRGVCPDGWHVMNQHEWSDIVGGGRRHPFRRWVEPQKQQQGLLRTSGGWGVHR